nr:Conjugal transfer protein TrbC [Pseudomonas putida]
MCMMVMSFNDQRFRMPLRMPKDIGGKDRTDYYEELVEQKTLWGLFKSSRTFRKLLAAGGIMYLGYLRTPNAEGIARSEDEGRELWLNNSDCRTHMWIPGTTGSGKSETLMALFFNALCWGSGACYADGKADSNLAFCLWSLARRLGREDDFLILNYLTGGMDPFDSMVARENGKEWTSDFRAQSNSLNPFGDGAADFLLQLLASLLPAASGDGAKWQEKAINMVDAVIRTLCYKRARGEIEISVATFRHYLALKNLVELYKEGQQGLIPETAYLPIKAYFETGLPGFNPDLVDDPSKWDAEVFNQHGYLTGQFSRIFSMMMDTYSHVFSDKYPEIDMMDVLLNDRLLVVMIPSLEKSASEAASLGKLYISSIRLMMAQNLGYKLEGTKEQVLDTKATNAPNPYLIISDELAYYFAAGIAVMFAQARSLGFMMVAAVQDMQGLKRGEAADEAASMLANTKVKWVLALEDPEDTYDFIRKAGGEGYYSVLGGYDESSGAMQSSFRAQAGANIEKRNKIELPDLKKLQAGEGMVIFKDSVVPSSSFYIPDEHKKTSKLSARINRFLQIERPEYSRLPHSAEKISTTDHHSVDYITAQLRRVESAYYPKLDDPILDEVVATATHLDGITRFEVTPEQRGIVLFQAARKAVHAAEAQGLTGYYHQVREEDEFEELLGDEADDLDIPEEAFDD